MHSTKRNSQRPGFLRLLFVTKTQKETDKISKSYKHMISREPNNTQELIH